MATEGKLALRETEKLTTSNLGLQEAMETPLRQDAVMHNENDPSGKGVISAGVFSAQEMHDQNVSKGKGVVSAQRNVEDFMNVSLNEGTMIKNQNDLNLKGKAIASEGRHVEDKMDLPDKQPAMVPNPNDLNVNEPPSVSEERNVNFQNNAAPQPAQEVVIDALPVSTVIPEDYDYAKYGTPEVQNYDVHIHEVISDTNTLTKSDRQSNWYMEERPRKSGITDKYYTHLLSDVRCRSLTEVKSFVEFGRKSTRQQPHMGENEEANKNDDAIQTGAKKQRGSSLIKKEKVGYYLPPSELETSGGSGYICRRKPSELETIAAETSKAIRKGRSKKKGEENAAEDENKGESAALPAPVRMHTLMYDFFPKK